MPQLPGQLAYCVTVAYGDTCEIAQFEYAELADAERAFLGWRQDDRTLAVTLCGPADETIMDYCMPAAPVIGQSVTVKSGMTGKVAYTGTVLSVSATGKRVTVSHPRYATGKATFYRTGTRYTESYGGVSHLNDSFAA